ncbi:MAG: hypothetical protein HY073_00535, partial [Deltaproteobacteria bacterium]|nr:hypothetical protein [Deltaproteobacteria bacterium]
YGKNKFSILLSKCHRSDAVGCARRVLGKVKQEASGLVVAMGVLHYQGISKISRPRQILTLAEKALTQAKKEERTHYVLAA